MKTILSRFFGAHLKNDDLPRLESQQKKILTVMSDGKWRTLFEIQDLTGFPDGSISRQLRYLKTKGYKVNARSRDGRRSGTWEYQVILSPVALLAI